MNPHQQPSSHDQRPQRPLNSRELLIKNRKQISLALQMLFASDYISRRRLYWENFVRGIFFAIGGIIGVTLGIGLLLWVLSFFDQVPLIGPVIENISHQVENGSIAR